MAGSAAYERRDFRAAARHWRALLAQVPAGTPAHVELSTAIERADKLGALTLPPAAGTAGAPGS
jgi:cytochrome c-type biogenesis protein CcmH/NrfG